MVSPALQRCGARRVGFAASVLTAKKIARSGRSVFLAVPSLLLGNSAQRVWAGGVLGGGESLAGAQLLWQIFRKMAFVDL